MLECQVSLKDFCEAMKSLCPFDISDRKQMYPGTIDCFEEYRYHYSICSMHFLILKLMYRFLRHSLHNINYLCEDLDAGNRCPACPPVPVGQVEEGMLL